VRPIDSFKQVNACVRGRRLKTRAGESHIEDISSDRLGGVLGAISAIRRFAALARTDAIIVCVPTPLTPNREPDLRTPSDSAIAG
jgi:UDP-N-acetyl-D-glucosamine dehydrogenase